MCCVCESGDSFGPSVSDPEFHNALAQIEDGPRVSCFAVYDSASNDEARFRIDYCPVCGRKLRGDDRR